MTEPAAISVGSAERTLVRPDHDLVLARLPELRAELRKQIAAGATLVTLDLAEVQSVDSAGIGLVVSTHNSLKKLGGDLAVINASPDVNGLFRAMRIHQHMLVSAR